MDLQTQLNSDQLRLGLAQLLRSYTGAGLKRFHRSSSDLVSPQVLQQLIALSSADSPTASSPVSVLEAGSSAALPADFDIARPQQNPAAAPTTGKNSSARSTEPTLIHPVIEFAGQWQMPAASIEERQAKLIEIDTQVRACRKCEELVCYRRQTVFGEGNLRPRVCFYGEAPGADEDAKGRPFVGAAGKLLTDIIRAMRLTREEVYIMNSLKCRPPQNRTPLPEEVENCRPYALAQLELLQPEFIVLLGAVAVRSVLQSTDPVGRLRGRFHQFHGARVLVTYHPAYLLRNMEAKKLVWTDVQMVMREMGTPAKS